MESMSLGRMDKKVSYKKRRAPFADEPDLPLPVVLLFKLVYNKVV